MTASVDCAWNLKVDQERRIRNVSQLVRRERERYFEEFGGVSYILLSSSEVCVYF